MVVRLSVVLGCAPPEANPRHGRLVRSMTGQLAPTWQVQLLGPIRAWRDGAEVDLGTARMRAVFAVLAVHANRVVSKTELVDAIWGQAPPSKVAASLYTYISRLRRALEPPGSPDRGTRMIESAGTGYSLRLDSQAVDVTRFVALRDECESLLDSGDIAGATAMLNSALELWYGEPLSGLTGPFAQSQRIRLTELRLAMLEQRAEATLAAGRAAEAVAQLSGLIAEHPTRETLRGLLLIALYRSGRTVEALDSYREARETMVAELGIEPGPALRRIHDQLLADDPALLRDRFKAAAVTAPRDTGDGARTPHTADFVGRARELGELRDRIADLNQGRGCVVWIEGEPGIGKSALVTEAIGPSGGGRIRVLRATGDELGQRWPLWLIMDCLAVTPRSPDPRRRELVGARYGNRRPGQGWEPVDPLPAPADRILGLVGELCAEGPLVLVLEDLQWADEASLLVWRNLVKLTRKVPLMLVGVCRPVPKREELDYLREAACADGGP